EGLDPQNIQQIAENNCLASAAKLPGVTVTIKQKTVQSLSGVDSNEVAQITPLQATVKCEWTHRHLESIGTAFRLFLECQVDKKSLSVHSLKSEEQVDQSRSSAGPANALLTVATTPRADVIAISGANGERVINPTANSSVIDIHNGDETIQVRKIGYKDQRKSL